MANYDVLRLILEKAANLPFPEIIDNYLFKPLNMRDSAFSGDADAVAYAGGKRVEGAFTNEIVTTAEDIAKFYAAILDGVLLPLEKYLSEIPENGFGCGWYRSGGVLTHNSDFGGFALETRLRPDDGGMWINLRNRPPIPDNGDRIIYFDVKNCGDGYVKIEAWEADNAAEFGVYSVKVFDNDANELYSAGNNGEYFIEVKNNGEKRQASEFAEKYYYELDLKELLGERFSSDEVYVIEVKAHCKTPYGAQLGCVYQSGGEWISGCYYVFNEPWQAYDLFLEQLNLSRGIM